MADAVGNEYAVEDGCLKLYPYTKGAARGVRLRDVFKHYKARQHQKFCLAVQIGEAVGLMSKQEQIPIAEMIDNVSRLILQDESLSVTITYGKFYAGGMQLCDLTKGSVKMFDVERNKNNGLNFPKAKEAFEYIMSHPMRIKTMLDVTMPITRCVSSVLLYPTLARNKEDGSIAGKPNVIEFSTVDRNEIKQGLKRQAKLRAAKQKEELLSKNKEK